MHTDRKGENIMGNTTEARTIYILLTRSGTWFSRLIHLATADSYTHASIGLDGPIGPFYSFARKYSHFASRRAGGGTNRSGAPDQEAAGPLLPL